MTLLIGPMPAQLTAEPPRPTDVPPVQEIRRAVPPSPPPEGAHQEGIRERERQAGEDRDHPRRAGTDAQDDAQEGIETDAMPADDHAKGRLLDIYA